MKPLVTDEFGGHRAVAAAGRTAGGSACPAASRWTAARFWAASCLSSKPASAGTTCPPNSATVAARSAATRWPSGSGSASGTGCTRRSWRNSGRPTASTSPARRPIAPRPGRRWAARRPGRTPRTAANSAPSTTSLIDGNGVPLATTTTGANRHDSKQFVPLLDAVPEVAGKVGHPRRTQNGCSPTGPTTPSRCGRSAGRGASTRTWPAAAPNTAADWACSAGRSSGRSSWLHQFRRLGYRRDRLLNIHQAFVTLGLLRHRPTVLVNSHLFRWLFTTPDIRCVETRGIAGIAGDSAGIVGTCGIPETSRQLTIPRSVRVFSGPHGVLYPPP